MPVISQDGLVLEALGRGAAEVESDRLQTRT